MNVYISYSSKDRHVVDRIAKGLEAAGISSWTDRNIPPGSEWMEQIDHAIQSADVFVVLITENFLHSPYCNSELGSIVAKARSDKSRIIPVIVDRTVLPEHLPAFLSSWRGVRLPDGPPSDRSLQEVVEAVDRGIH